MLSLLFVHRQKHQISKSANLNLFTPDSAMFFEIFENYKLDKIEKQILPQ